MAGVEVFIAKDVVDVHKYCLLKTVGQASLAAGT